MTDIDLTGPDYPPPPGPGSNAIGEFQIGVSQIGDIPEFDPWITIASQFANSPIITGIIERFGAAVDQTLTAQSFYDNIWNIDTANGYGLDVWGRIVDVNRVVQVVSTSWFGFAEALPDSLPFNTGISLYGGSWVETDRNQEGGSFYTGSEATQNFALSDDSYRRVIMAKAAQNITDCSIISINQILLYLFPNRGNAYVIEGDMTLTYNFQFTLSPVEYAIVANSGVLPKPTGVTSTIIFI